MSLLRKRPWVIAGSIVWVTGAIWACGGGGDSPDGGADASSDAKQSTDSSGDVKQGVDAGDAGSSDATPDVQPSDAGAADVILTPIDAGATLTGDQGFPIVFTWMDNALPNQECGGSNVTADGGVAATAIILAANDLPFGCGDGGTPQGKLVEIGIATPAYAGSQTSTQTQSLAPGSFAVGDQKVPDEDFCMIPSGKTAWFQVLQFNDAGTPFATWNGVAGSIDVTTVTSTAVAGSFTVQLGDANGGSADGGTLSGTFAASTCGK